MSSAQGDGQTEDNKTSTSTTATTMPNTGESAKAPSKHTDDVKPKLSNGFSESHLESSVDEKVSSERPLTEVELSTNQSNGTSPNGSPVISEKTRRQVSHEREDSSSSIGTGGGDLDGHEQSVESTSSTVTSQVNRGDTPESQSQLESTSSSSHISTRNGKGSGLVSEDDSQVPPVTSEVVVATSPGGRFLKYDIEIGRGSFKTVYKGLDTETGVAVAWCELQEKRYNKSEQARFKEEVAILKTLQHPNILKLYDSWESTGQKKDKLKDKVLVLVTELMTSGTLKSYMRRIKSIKPKVIRSWGRQILRGLHFLHTRMPPIIHRDLKCDNIFINGTTGLVKIGDLGLATLKRNDVTTVIGTPEFMAPEMYEESYDESVDVYAFGMCLLEMCTQEYPYMECSNPAQIYKRVSQGIKPVAIDKIKDPALRSIIMNCTTVDKAQRFTVLDLLNNEYFSENLKIEMIPGSAPADTQPTEPNSLLTMRMDVPNQEPSKKNGQESIEFQYDLTKDIPEEVVTEMVKTGILPGSVQQMVSRSLREYVEPLKQKFPGRNKAENANAEVKGTEAKTETLSHSPSPAIANETPPTDYDQSSSSLVQRQPSVVSEQSRTEELVVSKESIQGLDMTGQGAIPAPQEREKTLPLNLTKGQASFSKTNDLLSPISSTSHLLSEHAPSTGQQIAASTGQAVPQPGAARDNGLKSQSTTVLLEAKSYSSVVKEGSTSEPRGLSVSHIDRLPSEPTQESSQLKSIGHSETVLSAPVQEIHLLSDNSSESTPVHQSSQGESDTSLTGSGGKDKMGTLKKKGSRHKQKGIKLLFKTYNVESKTIFCTLSTSNGKLLEYKFSIMYDKPEEMFRKFVKGDYLTEPDKPEFIRQSNQLIQNVKKGKTESQESKPVNLGIQEQQGKSRSSTEPALSPPSETAESASRLSSEQVPQSESRSGSKTVHFSDGSPKLEPKSVSVHQRSESITSDTPMLTPEAKEVSNPLSSSNGNSTSLKSQPVESVSSLVTHTTASQDPPVQPLPNPAPLEGNLPSCPLPAVTQLPISVPPVCSTVSTVTHSSNSPSTSIYPPPVQATRVFEVETVPEDKPDSPEVSDLSASGSTENLGRETQRSNSQDSNPSISQASKRFTVQKVLSLESKSDSYIGKDPAMTDSSLPNKVLDQTPSNSQPQPQQVPSERTKSPRHYSLPNIVPARVPKPVLGATIPEHYCTTSVLETAPTWQRVTEDTYIHPMYRRHNTSSALHNYPTYASSEGDAPEYETSEQPLNIDELPQASLLSEAFMKFMHSMSMVFRDPTFQPLMVTLDRKYGHQHLSEPSSAPPIRTDQQESSVSRSLTDPGTLPVSGETEEELRIALEGIEEEKRKLEKKKQKMIEDFQRRKHSSGNSSLESCSGHSESRKISTTSYDSNPMSPPQGRRYAKLSEYEEAVDETIVQPTTASYVMSKANTSSNAISEMERRVRDEITADKLRSGMISPSHFDPTPRSRTPQFQGPPLPTKSVSTYGMPSDRGGSVSPSLQASPPPSQTVGQTTFQVQTVPSLHQSSLQTRLTHTDSNEWTEYTSALMPHPQTGGQGESRTIAPQTVSRGSGKSTTAPVSRADVSEFDPISSTGHRPKL